MRYTASFRAVAMLLAALFLGGVGGASDLDALLFHRAGAASGTRVPHLEADAGTQCHAEHCLLAFRLAGGREAPLLKVPVRFEALPSHGASARPDAAPHCFFPGHHQQSRAPPAPLA